VRHRGFTITLLERSHEVGRNIPSGLAIKPTLHADSHEQQPAANQSENERSTEHDISPQ
jgi:hypothetical protein